MIISNGRYSTIADPNEPHQFLDDFDTWFVSLTHCEDDDRTDPSRDCPNYRAIQDFTIARRPVDLFIYPLDQRRIGELAQEILDESQVETDSDDGECHDITYTCTFDVPEPECDVEPKRGRDGVDGPRGDEGPRGQPGRAGSPGRAGNPGREGGEGEKGAKGQPGVNGSRGAAGKNGDVGQQGPAGPRGETGEDGPDAVGMDGLPGQKGPRGEDGEPGQSGEPGQDGRDGQPVCTYIINLIIY